MIGFFMVVIEMSNDLSASKKKQLYLMAKKKIFTIASGQCRRLFPCRKLDAIIGNQVFQNERCHICFSSGLNKVET